MADTYDLIVLGAGPGGYVAAIRASQLGLKAAVVEKKYWGGVCLNVGCIPSKALLHAAKVMDETAEMGRHGISFAAPQVDLDKLRGWKDGVVGRLTGGLSGLARQRKVTVVQGTGRFTAPNQPTVEGKDGNKTVSFEQAIIAAGSEPVTLPFIPHDDPRVIDSTGALAIASVLAAVMELDGPFGGLLAVSSGPLRDALAQLGE